MGENGRKGLGKRAKLVKKSSIPNCPKISNSDASLSERTCFLSAKLEVLRQHRLEYIFSIQVYFRQHEMRLGVFFTILG